MLKSLIEMIEMLEKNEMIDDQMIEILSYLYEDFAPSDDDQMVLISS